MMRIPAAVFVLSCGLPLYSQTLKVSPNPVTFRMAAAGPLPAPQTLTLTTDAPSPVKWGAAIGSDAPWLALSASSDTTPATIKLWLVDWRAVGQAPGTYTGTLTIAAPGLPFVSVSVIWTVVARVPDPTFTYPSGPTGCTRPSAPVPYPDAALCTVPGEKPPGTFQPPPLGGSYVDANFGGTVRIMTGPGVYHTYSANGPLSAKNRYLMVWRESGDFDVVDVATAQVRFAKVSSDQNFVWDTDNDSVYYYPSGTAFIRHDLSTGAETTVVDYAKEGHKFTLIKRGGTSGTSKDNWLPFYAPNEKQICALDLNNVKTYCAAYGSLPDFTYGGVDYVLVSKGVDKTSGKRYVILVGSGRPPGFYSVNLAAGRLDFEYRGPEDPDGNGNQDGICDPGERCMDPSHSDTLEDSSGTQYLVYDAYTNNPCEVATGTYQLNKGAGIMQPVELGGGKRRVMSLWQCSFPGDTDEHIGCARKAPYCVISTVPPSRTLSSSPVRFPHATEVLVMQENGQEIRRLAQTRSVRFSEEGGESYWAMPRAAISDDGSVVVSDSNFGERAAVRVTMIPTGYAGTPLAAVNAASFSPLLAPGAYATLTGANLANCTAENKSLTLPDNLCGTRVTFGGLPAMLTYASPRQVNVLVPRRVPTGGDVPVSVSVEGAAAPMQTVVPAAAFGPVAPSIFTYALDDGVSRAVVQNSAWVLNGPGTNNPFTAPARVGESQVLYANALGPTDQSVPDGAPAPSNPLARTVAPVDVYVNGVRQTVQFSGMTPDMSGLYQVNFLLVSTTPVLPEGQNFVWLSVIGMESPHLPFSIR
jgi:uncharacterized protein (TIGR03437 family)